MNTVRIVRDDSQDIYLDLKRINILMGKYSKEREFILDTLRKEAEDRDSLILIEEVEKGLHPEEQVEHIKNLIVEFNNAPTNILIITTNSTYILYTINNLMLAYLAKDNPHHKGPRISPDEVNIIEIEGGKIVDIKNNQGLLGKNSFDTVMGEVMDEFYTNLNYYDYRE